MDQNTATSPKHQAILNAASDAFAEHGFAKARIEDIAAKAGVGKGTVYEYFQSKEHLLLQCCIHICTANEEKISASPLLADTDQIDYHVTMHELVRSVVETIVGSEKKELRLFIQLWEVTDKAPALAEEVNTAIQQLYAKWEALVLNLFQAGVAAGAFKAWPDPDMFGKIITATVDGWIWQKSFRSEIEAKSIALRFADSIAAILSSGTEEPSHA